MTTYVIDASSTLKWIFEETETQHATRLVSLYLDCKILLIAPSLWLYEVTNVLRSAYKRNKITKKKIFTFQENILKTAPSLFHVESFVKEILKTALEYDLSAYDASYVTLAKQNNYPFITSDAVLMSKIRKIVKTVSLSSF